MFHESKLLNGARMVECWGDCMGWQEDFLKLYTSNEVSDYGKALDLKLENIPEKLYRYRPISDDNIRKYRFGEIVRGELRMSHPKELNDPFEACSQLGSTNPFDYISNKKELYAKQFAGTISEDKHHEIFSSDNWFDLLTTFVAKETAKQNDVEKNKNALEKTTLFGMEMINAHLSDVARKIVRFACFSTTATNLPMWNHYTNGHQGICLEYDTATITNIYHKNMLFPVQYVDKLPDVVSLMLQGTHPRFGLFEYMAMHKLKDWRYENEWRLIHDVGSWHYSFEEVPDNFYNNGKTIQFIRPSKIIMGIQISDSHKAEIERIAAIVNVPVIQAKQTEYGLDITG